VKEYIARNKVTVNGKRVKAADHVNVKDVRVAGNPLQYPETLHIMLHKPRGYVCSRVREAEAKMIYDLLPASFLRRNPLLVAAGRLDKWASGLLVLSQDGELVQKLTSPKRKAGAMGKVYEVQLQKELTGQESVAFASGELMLRSESEPCKPAGFEVIDPENRIVRITLFEGRYHQLRRMLAALGNRAVTIHRVQTGPLRIGDLPVRPHSECTTLNPCLISLSDKF
jgi:16S rRNA pseudouridine516 synthase